MVAQDSFRPRFIATWKTVEREWVPSGDAVNEKPRAALASTMWNHALPFGNKMFKRSAWMNKPRLNFSPISIPRDSVKNLATRFRNGKLWVIRSHSQRPCGTTQAVCAMNSPKQGVTSPRLSAQELSDLLVYLRNLPFTKDIPAVFETALFVAKKCQECHQSGDPPVIAQSMVSHAGRNVG